MEKGFIYVHINKINNKKYVGQTIQKPEYRWNHGEGYKDSPLFYNDIKQYGWDNFNHIILEEVQSQDLNQREAYWIQYFKSNDKKYGYNLTSGGYGKLSEQQKERKKEALKKWRENNPEKAELAIKSMQQYWKEHPEEKKEALKKATLASVEYWKEHPMEKQKVMEKMRENAKKTNIKPVQCIETQMIYESAREASRQTGISYSGIGKVCKGRQNIAGGYHWRFIDKKEFLKNAN